MDGRWIALLFLAVVGGCEASSGGAGGGGGRAGHAASDGDGGSAAGGSSAREEGGAGGGAGDVGAVDVARGMGGRGTGGQVAGQIGGFDSAPASGSGGSAMPDGPATRFDSGADLASGLDSGSAPVDGAAVSTTPDYLIIAADTLAASAKRYRDFRRGGGFNVELAMVSEVVGDAADAGSASGRIVDWVRARYQSRESGRPMYLLLLGDAQATWPGDGTGVPAGSWQASAGAAAVVSDNVYADMDGDDVPDFAVGRITAHDDAEADLVRRKVAAYEGFQEAGLWDRRLSIFASTSGMGDLVDLAIESVVYDITEAIPYDYDITMTYARQTSPYVYIPEQFSDQVYRRINEGALLVAYVGHGSRDGFASLDWNGSSYPILDTSQLANLSVTHKPPVLLFVACSTGAFAGGDSVSERILLQDQAPSAILSSTEVSDPYANAIFIYEVSQAFTAARADTVGNAFVRAKQRMLSNDDDVRQAIDVLAGLLVSQSGREALLHSHLHMYTLFGDPGMAVSYPGAARLTVTPSAVSAGTSLAVTATFPPLGGSGEAVLTLESPRKVILGTIATVPADGDPNRDEVIGTNYEIANDKVAAGATVSASGQSVSANLTVPSTLPPGSYHVKILVHDAGREYAASAPVTVK